MDPLSLTLHLTSLVLGHLKVFGDFVKRNKPNAHADLAIVVMNRALGRPPLMFIDMRPINDLMVVVGDYEISDQLTKASKIFPTSPPKSSKSLERLLYLTGPTSIFSQHKLLRKRFNPGFAPQYLVTFVPEILDKGLIFLERLDSLSKTQDTFALMSLTTRLTFDVIGKVIMETDLDAQYYDQAKGELVDFFETLLDVYNGERLNLPWWLNIRKVRRRAALSNRITSLLQEIDKIHVRSVLSLGLQDSTTLTLTIMDEMCDQLRTFLFAGHDTTSILLSWVFYELSRTPRALSVVHAELNSLLGPDASPTAVRARLLEREDLVQQMSYISAVIKETLRLHPPGGTARVIPPGSGFTVRMPSGQQQCLDGLLVYNCQSIIHTDPKAFGNTANDFELANIEARVIIALTARRYDFVKVGLGEVVLDESGRPSLDNTKGQYRVTEELYTTRQVTSKPVDGMMMRVRLV
ncbi:cytochrome P450 [Biscogniauxia marginata]|nr:cytochrome P450 [Biscogniauxia marginata]